MKKLFVALALCVATAAHADFWNVEKMMSHVDSDESVKRSLAIAYIMGVHDAGNGVIFCSPPDVTGGSARDLVRHWVNRIPSMPNASASVMVTEIFRANWKCPMRRGDRL